MILHWLASPEWAQIVKALLHTLWQASLLALLLATLLRRLTNPSARYRLSLSALLVVLVSGLVSWAVLNRGTGSTAPLPASTPDSISTQMEVGNLGKPSVVATASRTAPKPAPPRWTAWLAMVWLAGAGLMLARAGAQVAGAERLRRSCRPLEDRRIAGLVAEAQRAIGLARQLRLVATDRLTSPAVVGVLVPTLILPLSLVTALTPEQIRFVLLHELAHIRRGDYLANLFQLFAEALLFFNPAVWWISHQVRREREACCDALAIELSGAPADYARTLVHVAESILNPPPAAAPAFGDEPGKPSSLTERVQRLLVPGYRPALRLTWRAMLTSLMLGGALLVLTAVGTRVTVAQILVRQKPPEQPLDITSGNSQFDSQAGVGHYRNNVVLRSGGTSIFADWMSVNRTTGEVIAEGHVRMQKGDRTTTGEKLHFNFKTCDSSFIDLALPHAQEKELAVRVETNERPPDLPNAEANPSSPGGEGRRHASTEIPQTTGTAPPQININVKFVEVPEDFSESFGAITDLFIPTNVAAGKATPATLMGILTEPQFKTMFRALEQRHGVETVSAGQVTTLSGRQAQIQVIDPGLTPIATGIKPNTLKPPGVRSGDSNALYQTSPQTSPVQLGPIFDVLPTVGPDGSTVDLQMVVTVFEFLGYDPATNSVEAYLDGRKQTVPEPLPHFRACQMTNRAIVWDGQTVMLGGALTVETAAADNTGAGQKGNFTKKKLLVFATATIIDSAGNRVHWENDLPAARTGIPPQNSRASSENRRATDDAQITTKETSSASGLVRARPAPLPQERELSVPATDTIEQHLNSSSAATTSPSPGGEGGRHANSPSPGSRTNLIHTSRGRQEIMAKLNQIRVDTAFYGGLPLSEVMRNLGDEVKRSDPDKRGINFLINRSQEAVTPTIDPATGLPVAPDSSQAGDTDIASVEITLAPARQNIRLVDLLDAIVKSANRPIQYAVMDYAIVFSALHTNTPPPLFTRKYKFDPNTFKRRLEPFANASPNTEPLPTLSRATPAAGDGNAGNEPRAVNSANPDPLQAAVRRFLASFGVDMRPETGKSVFYNDSRGELLVRATRQDQDTIEQTLANLEAPGQVNVRGTFFEVSNAGFAQLLRSLNLTNATSDSSTQQFTAILTEAQSRAALSELERGHDAKSISEGQVTTLTERQAQIQAVSTKTIVLGITNGMPQTQDIYLGPTLDVISKIMPDGNTIEVTAIPTATEFLGYDDPGPFRVEGNMELTRAQPAPHLRVRQMTAKTNVLDGETLLLATSTARDIFLPNENVRTVPQSNHLVVFVTPTIIDAAGNRVHAEEVPRQTATPSK